MAGKRKIPPKMVENTDFGGGGSFGGADVIQGEGRYPEEQTTAEPEDVSVPAPVPPAPTPAPPAPAPPAPAPAPASGTSSESSKGSGEKSNAPKRKFPQQKLP